MPETPEEYYFPTCRCGMSIVELLQKVEQAEGLSRTTDLGNKAYLLSIAKSEENLINGGKQVVQDCGSLAYPGLIEELSTVLKNPKGAFDRISQQLIDSFRDCIPSFAEPKTVKAGLKQSIEGELEAITNYVARATHAEKEGDFETAGLYRHIKDEEISHKIELKERAKIYRTITEASPEDLEALRKKFRRNP